MSIEESTKLRSKYYWENDYHADKTYDIKTVKKIEEKPKGTYLKKFHFSSEIIAPIVVKILQSIENQEKIGICGDYDVDGTSGTAILVQTIQALGGQVVYEIPQRFIDGYGISNRIIDVFKEKDVSLIVTVDNGIAAIEEIAYARENNFEIIITDHHTVGEKLPDAHYILHPELDDTLAFKEVCGAFVAYQLAVEMLTQAKYGQKDVLIQKLQQFAMIATIADMMPIEDVNRDITYMGFRTLKEEPLPFFQSFQKLMEITKFRSDDLSYQLLPAINSVGRIGESNQVVEAMLETNIEIIQGHMQAFIEMNAERKKMTNEIYQEVVEKIQHEKIVDGFQLVIGDNWHQGVLGIVAQRLMLELGQPVIVVTTSEQDENILTGSARAFGGYDVYDCFSSIKDDLSRFGGHQYAGGLSLEKNKLNDLKEHLKRYNIEKSRALTVEEKVPQLSIDTWQKLDKLDMKFLQYQERFEPFGEKNKPFTIGIHHVKVLQMQELGKTREHVKLFIEQNGKKYQIVAFGEYQLLQTLALDTEVDLVIHVQANSFNGQTTVQYLLVDIRKPENQIFDYRSIKYQDVEIVETKETLVVEEVPLDVAEFMNEILSDEIANVYLKRIAYEDLFIYETTISKEAFNYVYKVITAQEKLNLKEETTFVAFYKRKLPKSIVLYIIKVFFELGFVIIEENVCIMNNNITKKSLEDSDAYNEMSTWLEFRNLILFEPTSKISDKLF